ncbi:Olfactory receptor 2B6 [Varanus komodoensis]|uniref:olfactory receptor 2G3-like n=1 Tax=Varanus komodoensis TaxID=61221 RepID=UPI001CF767CD|nr:olfactory receptor 2G3-like [Varanus komodoensis]KAF7237976.1 Olfactory receptor 2B6 [Varanus komodoensis]
MWIQNGTSVNEFILLGFTSHPTLQHFLLVLCLVISLITMLGNSLIIILVWVDYCLHKAMYFFIGNLSLLDIFFTLITVPQMLVHMASWPRSISFNRCMAQLSLTLCCGITECFILALMAYDRYMAICQPLRYPIIMRTEVSMQMAGACWLGGFLNAAALTVITINFPFCGPNKINHFFCEEPAVLQLACMDTYMVKITIFALSVIVLMLPFTFIVVSYIHIARVVLSIQSMEGRKRAFSTCFTHLTVVILFYSTISFTYLQPQSDWAADQEKKASVFYALVSPMLNPIIYSLRNKDVKRALAKVMGKIS